jgi:hypothetical protein
MATPSLPIDTMEILIVRSSQELTIHVASSNFFSIIFVVASNQCSHKRWHSIGWCRAKPTLGLREIVAVIRFFVESKED